MSTEPNLRLDRYQKQTSTLMLVLAAVFIAVFAAQVLWMSAPPWASSALGIASGAIWLAFVLDFAIRVWLSKRRWHYIVTHPIDIIVVIIPMARVLRILRVFAAVRVVADRGSRIRFGHVWSAVGVAVVVLAFVGALSVLSSERGVPGSTIDTMPEALWWAFVTMTTVGYGDVAPITPGGQLTAVIVMLLGIGLLGTVTGAVAGWFAEQVATSEQHEHRAVTEELAEIRRELAEVRELLVQQQSGPQEP